MEDVFNSFAENGCNFEDMANFVNAVNEADNGIAMDILVVGEPYLYNIYPVEKETIHNLMIDFLYGYRDDEVVDVLKNYGVEVKEVNG